MLSSRLLILIKSTLRDPGFYLLAFSSWWSRLDKIQYNFMSSSRFLVWWNRLDNYSVSRLLVFSSSWIWQDQGSCLLVFSSSSIQLDEIQALVFSSFHPHQVELMRSRILSSRLLILIKSTWRDPGSCLLVFSSSSSRIDEIQDLVFSSSHPHQVDVTRSRILSSSVLVLNKSTWRDWGSCLFVFSPRLLIITSWLLFSSARLVFSSSLPDLPRLLGALFSFRTFLNTLINKVHKTSCNNFHSYNELLHFGLYLKTKYHFYLETIFKNNFSNLGNRTERIQPICRIYPHRWGELRSRSWWLQWERGRAPERWTPYPRSGRWKTPTYITRLRGINSTTLFFWNGFGLNVGITLQLRREGALRGPNLWVSLLVSSKVSSLLLCCLSPQNEKSDSLAGLLATPLQS